jgi:CMP/dCMP kinase
MIIAVDGPSASGKGTLARALARHMGFHYLDTGTLYRMVGLAMLRAGKNASDDWAATDIARTLDPDQFTDKDLRTETVASMASKVAQIPAVRAALLDFQRNFALRPPGAVLDGRDIGTVICPDADLKFFVTASPQIRAQRRLHELQGLGVGTTLEEVLADVNARDARDAKRTLQAEDVVLIDTSDLTIAEVMQQVIAVAEERRNRQQQAKAHNQS